MIEVELGRAYSDLFDWRQKGDYSDFFDFTKDDVQSILEPTKQLIEDVRKVIGEA